MVEDGLATFVTDPWQRQVGRIAGEGECHCCHRPPKQGHSEANHSAGTGHAKRGDDLEGLLRIEATIGESQRW